MFFFFKQPGGWGAVGTSTCKSIYYLIKYNTYNPVTLETEVRNDVSSIQLSITSLHRRVDCVTNCDSAHEEYAKEVREPN